MKRMLASALVVSACALALAGPVHAQKATDKEIATKPRTPTVAQNAGSAGDAYPAGAISRPDPGKAETKTLPGHMPD